MSTSNMATATRPQEQETDWGRVARISVSVGMSLGLVLSLVWLAIIWVNGAHPPFPKPWDRAAIVVRRGNLSPIRKGDTVEVTYVLENRTTEDYRIEYDAPLVILSRDKDGVLLEARSDRLIRVAKPIFIRTGEKAFLKLTLPAALERPSYAGSGDLRTFFQDNFRNVSCFAVFDSEARYEIDLPVPRSAGL